MFSQHLNTLVTKVDAVTFSLAKVMPNLRSPYEEKRRIFAWVLMSMLIYEAPVWAEDISRNRDVQGCLRRTQKRIVDRVSCAYKTVTFETAVILSRMIPVDILAQKYKNLYHRIKDLQSQNVELTQRTKDILKIQATEHALLLWKDKCRRASGFGKRVREPISSYLEE